MNEKQFIQLLRDKGKTPTQQRINIFNILHNSKDHPTAKELHKELLKIDPEIGITTIYRTLEVFKELNLVQELEFDEGSRFEPNLAPHINIKCPNCGKIDDYESKTIEKFWQSIIKEMNGNPIGYRIDLYQYCNSCP